MDQIFLTPQRNLRSCLLSSPRILLRHQYIYIFFTIKKWRQTYADEIYGFSVRSSERNSTVENVRAFPRTLWSNGSSLIDLSCLFKLQWNLRVPLSNASLHANFSPAGNHFLSATALDSIIVNQEHMVFLAQLRLTTSATRTPPFFSRLVYKLEQLNFTATSYRPVLLQEARPRLATLWMGHYYEMETQAGPAQFSWLSVSTHHIGKQLYYKLVCFLWQW